jgi:protein-tyrosine phosphatase
VTKQILDRFNLVLTMEQGHKEALRAEFPQCADRVFMLSELVGERHDIRDPIGGSLVDFRATVKELDRILTEGYEKIKQLAGG